MGHTILQGMNVYISYVGSEIEKKNSSGPLHRDALNNGCAVSPFALLVLCLIGEREMQGCRRFFK